MGGGRLHLAVHSVETVSRGGAVVISVQCQSVKINEAFNIWVQVGIRQTSGFEHSGLTQKIKRILWVIQVVKTHIFAFSRASFVGTFMFKDFKFSGVAGDNRKM